MQILPRIALPLLTLMLLCGSGCMTFDAEIKELRKSVTGDELSFAGLGISGQVVNVDRVVDVELFEEIWDYVDYTRVIEITVRPESGIQDLNILKFAEIGFQGTTQNLPSVVLASYDATVDQPNASDGSVTCRISTEFDHTAYLRNSVPFSLSLEFELPANDFSVSLDVGVDVSLSYSLL